MRTRDHAFFSGTSGLVLPGPRSSYPPEFEGKSRLEYYASLFNSVEINSSFYKLPMSSTVSKWVEGVPDDFVFSFKCPKIITHAKDLSFNARDVSQFIKTIEPAANKKGCILIQFPASVKAGKTGQLKKLLAIVADNIPGNAWNVAVEFRDRSWYDLTVYELLKSFNAAMVIHDLPASRTPVTDFESDIMYIRLHGPGGRYRGSYTDEFLQGYAQHARRWQQEGKTVYCYFNNTMGDAVKNLETFNKFVLSD